ncbi:RdgB/HAM1 family non-canonical purine NTP pyrophosphatase [Myxococcota bacterium]|nr:RdgB/HAM1 family non-canonical purine NTP pyrophosphatase [Myxococcota bacterium]
MPRRFVFATGNAGKQRELERILAGFEIRSLRDFPAIAMPEEGDDYAANALAKAVAVLEATGIASLGDDSGVEVDALGGRPGVHSARYGGPGLDDRGRIERLLRELAPFPEPRAARFVCVAACALPDGRRFTVRGECEGTILREPRGNAGFGYDPIFVPNGEHATWAELPDQEKDRLSHRAKAFRTLIRELA